MTDRLILVFVATCGSHDQPQMLVVFDALVEIGDHQAAKAHTISAIRCEQLRQAIILSLLS